MQTKTRQSRKAILLSILAVSVAGTGIWAGFTDTDSASRAVDNGQLDIQVAPQLLSVSDIAPGDMMSRGLVIDFPAATNDGDLIDYIEATVEGSTADFCEDVNAVCDVSEANLLDARALTLGMLACPGIGTDALDWVPGRIADANPTFDDDGDPTTDSRMDGSGPYTCSSGDFLLLAPGGFTCNSPTDCETASPTQALFTPTYSPTAPVWADASYFGFDPTEVGALSSVDKSGYHRFVGGQQVEMVSCIAMNDDIGTTTDLNWDNDYYSPNVPDGLLDNDYENLSANIEFTFDAYQGTGEVQPRQRESEGFDTDYRLYAQDCESLIPTPPPPPVDPFVDGDNTIRGRSWYEAGHGIYTLPSEPGFGWYEDTGLDETFDDFFVDQDFDLTFDPEGPDEQTITISSSEISGYEIDTLVDGNYRITATGLYGLLPPGLGTDPNLDSDLLRGTPDNPDPSDWKNGHLDFTISGGQVQNYWIGTVNVPS